MRFTIFAALLLTLLIARHAAAADEVLLAADKQARLPIVVGPQASDRTQAAAQTLADYLGRISGAAFTVTKGDGSGGLVVGVPGDFTELPFQAAFHGGPRGREDYLLRSAADGVWLVGASDLAVTHAVWDLLYRLEADGVKECRMHAPFAVLCERNANGIQSVLLGEDTRWRT